MNFNEFSIDHSKERVLVIGSAGRLGRAMCDGLLSAGYEVSGMDRDVLDITDGHRVRSILHSLRPQVIVNCSAYNAVDAAECDPDTAFAINARGPANLAKDADVFGALLVHYSTDFVFDGRTSRPYLETDQPNPLSVYAASKLEGENEVRKVRSHFVLRLASLFGGSVATGQKSTVDHFADALQAGLAVRAATDRTVSPSYVPDVVRATRDLIERRAPFGIYHCVNSGFTTWFDLAGAIARRLRIAGDILPIHADALTSPARRPRFCALSNDKLRSAGVEIPSWQSALARHVGSTADTLDTEDSHQSGEHVR